MGQAKIISNLGQGAYTVEIVKDVDRIGHALDRCDQGVSEAEAAQAKAQQVEASAKAEVVAAGAALDEAIRAAGGDASSPGIKAAQDLLDKAAWALEDAQQALALAKLKKLAYEDEKKTYDGIISTEQRSIWCADATDDLVTGSTVGTIEINQESTQVLVAPGGDGVGSVLQPGMANDGVAAYLNWGLLPGVQRWKPTYRVGTIKEIDYDADTAMVCLDDARSSAQNIKINPDGVECETQKDGPAGFVDFCKRSPGHPACATNGSTSLAYSSDLIATLTAINNRINRNNTYTYDSAQYGKLENWEEMPQSGGRGDCEDFALAKYRACLNAGIPASALKLATGKTSNGTGHAWLEVQTDKGNVALDLNTQDATFSDGLPYSNRAVQADGINWSGKGLLLQDVPVEYMQCNASAFKEGDRVVVHFKDSSWSKPRVIGFEEKPQNCGICVVYRQSSEFKSAYAVFKSNGIEVVPNTIVPDKITDISGHVHFFRRDTEMNIEIVDETVDPPTTKTEKRRVIIYVSPLLPDQGVFKYRGDPATMSMTEDAGLFDWRVAVIVQDVETGLREAMYIRQSMPGMGLSVYGATGQPWLESWAFNWSEDAMYFFGTDGLSTGNIPLSSGTAHAYGIKIIKTDGALEIERVEKAKIQNVPTGRFGFEGIAVSNTGEAYYSREAEGIRAVDIATGAIRDVYDFVWPATSSDETTPFEFLWSFFMRDAPIGFDVGFSLRTEYLSEVAANGWLTHRGDVKIYGLVEPVLEAERVSYFHSEPYKPTIDIDMGTDITSVPRHAKFLLFPSSSESESALISLPVNTRLKDGTVHENYVNVNQSIKSASSSVDTNAFEYFSSADFESNIHKYACPMCLSDLHNSRTGERIQAVRSVNVEDGAVSTKSVVVLRNGEDVTPALAQALGVQAVEIMGVIDISGLV